MNKITKRWPLHPQPQWEESLSSWLHRLADAYWITLDKWFEMSFNEPAPDDFTLDLGLSENLIEALSVGTGVDKNYLNQMTVKGYAPWIVDGLQESQFDIDTDYCTQSFSPIPWGVCNQEVCCRSVFKMNSIPWVNKRKLLAICAPCIETDFIPYLRIFWRLALLGSCIKHNSCLVEARVSWQNGLKIKSIKNKTIILIDERAKLVDSLSMQALTTGYVSYEPYIKMSAAIYCRWVRFLISELFCLSHDREDIKHVWYAAEVSLKLGFLDAVLYENFTTYDRYRTLIVIGFILIELLNFINGQKLDLTSRYEVASKLNRQWWHYY